MNLQKTTVEKEIEAYEVAVECIMDGYDVKLSDRCDYVAILLAKRAELMKAQELMRRNNGET